MEPHANNVERLQNTSPEQANKSPELTQREKKLEHVPIGALEQLSDSAAEKAQVSDNSLAITSDDATTLPTVPVPPADDTTTGTATSTQNPSIAADDDVIEKEWVNKAKKVIQDTKGDPYAKEQEVSKLQADYMQKRYGKRIKLPDES